MPIKKKQNIKNVGLIQHTLNCSKQKADRGIYELYASILVSWKSSKHGDIVEWQGALYGSAEGNMTYPWLNSVLKLFLCVSFYRLLRFSWLSCPSFLKSVCFCRINNYRHQGSVPIFLFCYISLPLILLTISLVFIMAMIQNAIISEVSSTQIMRLFCSMNCSG